MSMLCPTGVVFVLVLREHVIILWALVGRVGLGGFESDNFGKSV